MKPEIATATRSYHERYPQVVRAAIAQQNVFWAAEKMGVDKDKHDFLTQFTKEEFNATLNLQIILTQYELMIGGEEMWGGKIFKMFPRPEIQRMCIEFAHAELCSHAPFYKELNKVLDRDTQEFYEQYLEIPQLAKHIEYIENKATSKDPLETLAALCFLEGVVLFSAFAFFKSFNTNGWNLIPHFVSGIDASAKDENFHCMGSAWLFNTYLQEAKELGIIKPEDEKRYEQVIEQLAKDAIEHEYAIIDLLYEYENIRTVSKEDMKEFIIDRVNIVYSYLGLSSPYAKGAVGKISEWFYENINSFKYSDFFVATQSQYTKNISVDELGY